MPEPAPVTRVILFCKLNMECRCAQSGRRDKRRSTIQEGIRRGATVSGGDARRLCKPLSRAATSVVQPSRLYNYARRPETAPLPIPQRSGRIVRRAFANPERRDSSQRGMRCSLSLREIVAARSARARGNETQPTKTAGPTLQAQLDRLPEPEKAAGYSGALDPLAPAPRFSFLWRSGG